MSTYIRLTDYKDSESKEQGFFEAKNRYVAKQEDFAKIPGSPIAYWVSGKFKQLIVNDKISSIAFSDGKNVTGNNDIYLKQLWEVNLKDIGLNKKWLFMMKGGEYRKWYGNIDYLIDWDDNARQHYRKSKIGRLIPEYLWYSKGITWSKISSKNASFRILPEICTFDEVNITLNSDEEYNRIFSYLNSKVGKYFLDTTNQTLSFQTENILSLPIISPKQESTKQQIDTLTGECIDISKEEWDSRETSWDFSKNELLKHKSDSKLETAYNNYCSYWKERFYKLHANEEELNRLFIDIYELGDELTPDVDLKDITILKSESIINDNNKLEFKADEIMKQFISYAVGCMLGRYSIDRDGLVVANMGQDYPRDTPFAIDDDNILPVLEEEVFSDDIVGRFGEFLRVAFGDEHYEANIGWIEEALGMSVRKYFVSEFYKDHVRRYKKRPIYWLIQSPKKSFSALIYMHRYQSDTMARVQTMYLREYITKIEAKIEALKAFVDSPNITPKESKKSKKELEKLEAKLADARGFDRGEMGRIAAERIEIDLDDGVKVNYQKFRGVLADIGIAKDE